MRLQRLLVARLSSTRGQLLKDRGCDSGFGRKQEVGGLHGVLAINSPGVLNLKKKIRFLGPTQTW